MAGNPPAIAADEVGRDEGVIIDIIGNSVGSAAPALAPALPSAAMDCGAAVEAEDVSCAHSTSQLARYIISMRTRRRYFPN